MVDTIAVEVAAWAVVAVKAVTNAVVMAALDQD